MQRPAITRVCGVMVFGLVGWMAVSSAQAGYIDAVMSGNPLGYWRLDETSGASAGNVVSGGVAGTYAGFSANDYGKPGALAASGDANAAAGFDGADNHIVIPESVFTTVGASAFSIEMWFNPSNPSTRGDLFAYKNGFASDSIDFGLFTTSDNGGRLAFWSTAAQQYKTGSTALSGNTWYHVVLTRDSSSNITAYLNGVEQFSVSGSTEVFGSSGYNAWIGSNHGLGGSLDAPTFPFNGSIDEVAIYGHALSPSEIAAHYNAGITAVPEPTSAILLGSAALGLVCYAWRKQR